MPSARLWRSIGMVDRIQSRSTGTDVHRLVHVGQVLGPVDRPESFALCFLTIDRPVDRWLPMVKNMTVGGRPPAAVADFFSQRLVLYWGYKYPIALSFWKSF